MRAGIRTVLHKVLATTKEQHGWAHETMTVLNAIQRSPYAWAKISLHDTWQAEMRAATKASVALAGKTSNMKHYRAFAKPDRRCMSNRSPPHKTHHVRSWKIGASSTVSAVCPQSSKGLSSRAASDNVKPLSDHALPHFAHNRKWINPAHVFPCLNKAGRSSDGSLLL